LQIATGSLPSASVGTSYSATLLATGGVAPYTWTLVSGSLPPGLTLNSTTGELSGTPAQSGNFSFSLQVRDSAGASQQKSLTLSVSSTQPSQATITIAPNTTFQSWQAWRFAARATKLGSATQPCTVIPDAVLDAYHNDVVNDLGFNGLRLLQHHDQGLEAAANDNSDPFDLNLAAFLPGLEAPLPNDACSNLPKVDLIPKVVLPIRNLVLARSEPFELYVTFAGYRDINDQPAWWENNPQEAAEAVQAYWTWFRQNFGFDPDAFTFNEPGSGYFGANSWMGRFAVALGTRFNSMGVASRIELPNTCSPEPTPCSPDGSVAAFDDLTAVAGASAFIGRVTFHGYDYNSTAWPSSSAITARNNLRTRAQSLGVTTGMTEICCKSARGWDGNYANGLDLVRDMYLNMTEANVSVWEPLGIFTVCSSPGCIVGSGSGQNLINLEPDLSAYYLNPHYWVARQFIRYIRPGYVRVGATCSGCTDTPDRGPRLKAIAWKSPANRVVVNLINDSGSSLTVTVTGLPSATYDIFKLDPTLCFASGSKNRCVPQSDMQASTGSLTFTLPTDAVWTFRQR